MKKKLILILALVVLLLFPYLYQYRLGKAVKLDHFIEVERIKSNFVAHHIHEYFENIKKELILISRLDEVKSMDKSIESILWKIVINNIEKEWLTEVYITGNDFDGFRQPFMVFELEGEKVDTAKDEYHALEREYSEYAIISKWRNIFRKHKSDFLISEELNLCVDYRGFVTSAPIYKEENFMGQVSGMFSKAQLFKIINKDIGSHNIVILFDSKGNFITEEPSAAYSDFRDGPFSFNSHPNEYIERLEDSSSFSDIRQKMIAGEEGYGIFELAPGQLMQKIFIYYVPVDLNGKRWFLGVMTPREEMIKAMRK